MLTVFKVVGWSLMDAFLAWVVTFTACHIYDWVVPNADSNESRAWRQFALLMLSSWLGLLPGAVYGIIRARGFTTEVENRPPPRP
jgi:hypothetical protein